MRVAFLGLGIMGSRMAVHLVSAGHDVTVWNRTAAVADAWSSEHGAPATATPAAAAAGADVVITMVTDGPHVEAVLLGPDGASAGASAGTLFVDMSTIAPATVASIAAVLAGRDQRMLDAPVTGSSPAADTGTLTIMVGGEEADLERARPLLEAMGRTIVHVGPLGHGQLVKLINNSVAAANAVTTAEALVAGRAVGVDLERLVEVMSAGSGGSAVLSLKAEPMLTHEYPLLFKTAHMLKDVRHCLDAVAAAGVPFPAADAAGRRLDATVARGLADEDYAAVIEAVEDAAGLRL